LAEKTVTITQSAHKKLQEELATARQENAYLKEELANLKRLLFGAKRERYISQDDQQLPVFEEQKAAEQPKEEVQVSYKKTKPNQGKAKRLLLPADLPRETTVIYPDVEGIEDEEVIGREVTERLAYIPGKVYVERIERLRVKRNGQIYIAEVPTAPIEKSNAGASLLAYLLVAKYIDHLPFYRQVQQLKRLGITIPESTISGWFTKTCQLLEPLYEVLVKMIQLTDYLQVDETPIPVQSSEKQGATHTGYHWFYYLPLLNAVIVNYRQSRERAGPAEMLSTFQGAIQTDGYAAYEQIGKREGITHLGCWAHARRKFFEAKNNDPERAEAVILKIQALYAIEREAKEEGLNADQAYMLRQEKSVPLLKELKALLIEYAESQAATPKSVMGKAIKYTLGQWDKLVGYTENGQWHMDNNAVENKIRPVALGRKNYLFCGSHQHARYAAMIYSFFGTCKANGVEPLQWLTETLQKINDTKMTELNTLLPLQKTHQ